MPELTGIHIGLLALMLVSGVIMGWIFRADRCAKEKIAVNASWQEQLESQQSEHKRLAEQNRSLMEQISQYQASHKDYSNRARELSESLKEAFARRDELQRQLKDMRGNLEVAIAQRDRLRGELRGNPQVQAAAIKEKDDKIFKLSRELTSWQSRVPPLVERFQARDREARALEEELAKTRTRLQALEDLVRSDQTRIDALDAGTLPHGGDASNEPIAMTAENDTAGLQDQIAREAGADSDDELVPTVESTGTAPESGDGIFDPDEFAEALTDSGDDLVADEIADEEAIEPASPQALADPPGDIIPVAHFTETAESAGAETAQEQAFGSVFSPSGNEHSERHDRDDLQLIKGIGPSIERTLNDLGIYRFHQIAEMSEYDIDRVAQQLKGFRSRVYREDWIGQARDHQYQKNKHRP